MDWRARKYYAVTFSPEAKDMRIRHLKLIGKGVTVHFNSGVPKQPDEVEERGRYLCVIGCEYDQAEAVEYELRKAERNDEYCMCMIGIDPRIGHREHGDAEECKRNFEPLPPEGIWHEKFAWER